MNLKSIAFLLLTVMSCETVITPKTAYATSPPQAPPPPSAEAMLLNAEQCSAAGSALQEVLDILDGTSPECMNGFYRTRVARVTAERARQLRQRVGDAERELSHLKKIIRQENRTSTGRIARRNLYPYSPTAGRRIAITPLVIWTTTVLLAVSWAQYRGQALSRIWLTLYPLSFALGLISNYYYQRSVGALPLDTQSINQLNECMFQRFSRHFDVAQGQGEQSLATNLQRLRQAIDAAEQRTQQATRGATPQTSNPRPAVAAQCPVLASQDILPEGEEPSQSASQQVAQEFTRLHNASARAAPGVMRAMTNLHNEVEHLMRETAQRTPSPQTQQRPPERSQRLHRNQMTPVVESSPPPEPERVRIAEDSPATNQPSERRRVALTDDTHENSANADSECSLERAITNTAQQLTHPK